MADAFIRFVQTAPNTAVNTLFTVPVVDIATTPPVPVTTYIVKTIILHNSAGSGTVNVKLTHNDGVVDVEINNIDVAHGTTQQLNGPYVYQAGDSLKYEADATDLSLDVSVLEIKNQL